MDYPYNIDRNVAKNSWFKGLAFISVDQDIYYDG